MELKTDKIHRILNTPYDELRPQDFDAAQGQLDILIVEARDKQIDAFQFLENKLVCERDAALERVRQLTAQLFILQQKPVALDLMAERDAARVERDQLAQTATANAETLRMTKREHAVTVENLETALALTKAERDQLKGICERLKRELEEANGALYDSMQVESKRAARITDLERMAKTDAEAIANLTKERDQLDDELTELRQAPSGTKVQAEKIADLEDRIRVQYDLLQAERKMRIDPAYHAKLAADLEQAKAQADNAAAMVVSITAERDAAQERELKALRQLADLVEREAFYGWPRDKAASAFAKLAAEETAAALEAMNKREAEVDKYGYGRAPGTPPAKVVGMDGFVPPCERCGRKREQAPVDAGDPLCAACADRVVKEATGEHLATSIDGGQSWWCPKCQASIIPDVPHVCPIGWWTSRPWTCRRCGSSVLDGKDHGVGACPGDGMP